MAEAVAAADEPPSSGPFPYQIAPPRAVRRRRAALFALTGITAYALTLIATLPARLLLDRSDFPQIWLAVAGTVWNGEAALANGHAVRWKWAPLASLGNLSFVTDLEITGAGTELKGAASWGSSGMVVTNLNGEATGALLAALAPELPFTCDFPMRVEIDRIAFGDQQPGVAGEIRTLPGTCAARAGAVAFSSPVPALIGEGSINVGGSTAWVAPLGNRSARLVTLTVMPNGAATVALTPAGSALFPGAQPMMFPAPE